MVRMKFGHFLLSNPQEIDLNRSPAFLTSDDFIKSNEIFQNKMADFLSNRSFCFNDLMISSEHKKST